MTKEHILAVAALSLSVFSATIGGAMWISAVATRVDLQEKRFDEMRTEQVNRLQDELQEMRDDMNGSREEVLKWMAFHDAQRR